MKAPDVPVWLSLSDIGRRLGVHRNYICRAWYYGYIDPVAFLGERPCFDETAVDGARRYLGESRSGKRGGRRTFGRR